MNTGKEFFMRRAKSVLYRAVIASLLVGALIAGTGERSKVEAQGHTMQLLWSEQGTLDYSSGVMGTNRSVAGGSPHITGFPQGTDSWSTDGYPAAANGCSVGATTGTVTFAGAKGGYDWAALGTACSVAGHPAQYSGTGTFLVTQGYGLLKGASGGGSYAGTYTVLAAKAGQPLIFKYSTLLTGTVTLAS
jgi:hypothetical protein